VGKVNLPQIPNLDLLPGVVANVTQEERMQAQTHADCDELGKNLNKRPTQLPFRLLGLFKV